jgi:LmbE family N-acetylglucosaminyl deacetylase/glycosyltransferase involved in cell wall biosynthesis/GT2 family glycosyltransferase
MIDCVDESALMPMAATALPSARRVLVLAPHADDEVFGCGGSLHLLSRAGARVTVVIATDGAQGGARAGQSGGALLSSGSSVASEREAESCAAANVLGYPAPVFWNLPDRGVHYGEALVTRIVDAIKGMDAELVFAPALSELHPDHQALALAAGEAVRRLGEERRIAFYEVSAPLIPNALVDITSAEQVKHAAMQCFRSQLARQRYDEHITGLNRYRSYTLGESVRAAEAFFIVTASELAAGLGPLYESAVARRRRLGVATEGTDVPLVSVIVRSMDRPTLSDALASLAAQVYPNIEVVVVNAKGGSHSPLPDYGPHVTLRLIDAGAALKRSAAANAGLDAARGEYVAFLDDDDTLDADHISALVAALGETREPAVVYAGVRCVDRADPQRKVTRVFGEPFESRAKLLAGNFIPSQALLFPRRLVEDGARFDEALDVYEDWDFWLQLAERARFIYVGRVSATYFTGGSSEVSPLAFDVEAVRRAARALFDKWKTRVTPDELKALGDLYHQTKGVLLGTQGEVTRLAQRVQRTEGELHELENQLVQTDAVLRSTQAHLAGTVAALREMYASSSWRVTAPLRWCSVQAKRFALFWRTGYAVARHRGWRGLAERAMEVGRHDGMNGFKDLVERRVGFENAVVAELPPGARPGAVTLPPPSGKPEILFVSHEAGRTGAPVFLLNLIRYVTSALDVSATILLLRGGDLEAEFQAIGPTVVLGAPETLDARLIEALKARDIRLIYVNTISNGALQARLIALGCPMVCHVHELAFSIQHHFGGRNLRQVLQSTQLFLACSKAVHDHLRTLAPPERVTLAYPFIDVVANQKSAETSKAPLDMPPGAVVVCGCGLIGWRKGTDLFIHVARRVLAMTTKPVVFVWIGGPLAYGEYPRLEYEVKTMGIKEHLVFPGEVEAPARYFAQSDIFALPSREDPFPLVMLEAASVGKPIVCFAEAGGTPEFVEHDAGIVVPYLDIEAMAAAITRLVEDAQLRVQLGETGRRKVLERHDVEVGAQRIVQTLKPMVVRQPA